MGTTKELSVPRDGHDPVLIEEMKKNEEKYENVIL